LARSKTYFVQFVHDYGLPAYMDPNQIVPLPEALECLAVIVDKHDIRDFYCKRSCKKLVDVC
jgi:hypothetical protein